MILVVVAEKHLQVMSLWIRLYFWNRITGFNYFINFIRQVYLILLKNLDNMC